jgi:hypothetical protein
LLGSAALPRISAAVLVQKKEPRMHKNRVPRVHDQAAEVEA